LNQATKESVACIAEPLAATGMRAPCELQVESVVLNLGMRASIDIAHIPQDGHDAEPLLRKACEVI